MGFDQLNGFAQHTACFVDLLGRDHSTTPHMVTGKEPHMPDDSHLDLCCQCFFCWHEDGQTQEKRRQEN
jgi:hypothetical protein